MNRQNDRSQCQQQQHTDPAKHQASHTTLTVTRSGTDDNHNKLVLILATTTSAIDGPNATLAKITTGIQSQGTWIRRLRWN